MWVSEVRRIASLVARVKAVTVWMILVQVFNANLILAKSTSWIHDLSIGIMLAVELLGVLVEGLISVVPCSTPSGTRMQWLVLRIVIPTLSPSFVAVRALFIGHIVREV
jgi:hypothetical protein